VGIVTAGMLCIAAMMALFYISQRQWGRSFLEGVLALLFVDFDSDSLLLACVFAAAVAILGWWRKFSFLPLLAIIGAVVLVAKALGIGGSPSWMTVLRGPQGERPSAGTGNPAILHIIFDEHIGLEGLRSEGPEGQRLSDELRNFYLAHGFAVYGGAYSEHMHTVNAIPYILDFGRHQRSWDGPTVLIPVSAYFDLLAARGYQINVIQPDISDFCSGRRFKECVTYKSFSLRPTLELPLSTSDRTKLVVLKFFALSGVVTGVAPVWDFMVRAALPSLPYFDPENDSRSSSIAALRAFNELTRRLQRAEPGSVYFVHLLLPHYPYVVRSDCTYLSWQSWGLRNGSLEDRRRAYYGQIRCMNLKLSAALAALSRSPAGANSVVIIHGDHGSRITRFDPTVPNRGRYSDADMIASFSTLFAIRAPGISNGYFVSRQPVTALLRDFAQSRFHSEPHPRPPALPQVYLDGRHWKSMLRVPLAPSWVKLGDRPAMGRSKAGVSH
jgi:hypothetical protein